jgi:hypothetical protein
MVEMGNPSSERVAAYVREHFLADWYWISSVPRTPASVDAFAAGQPVVLRTPNDPRHRPTEPLAEYARRTPRVNRRIAHRLFNAGAVVDSMRRRRPRQRTGVDHVDLAAVALGRRRWTMRDSAGAVAPLRIIAFDATATFRCWASRASSLSPTLFAAVASTEQLGHWREAGHDSRHGADRRRAIGAAH